MRITTIIPAAASLLFLGSAVRAEERWAGDWIMKRLAINVSVTSWGDNCGVKPKSYATDAATPVSIREAEGHLIFSKGDVRTDACGTQNPKVRSVLAKKSDGRWKRICKTAADDPKSEQGEYLLEAADNNRLEYTATSTFNWTLKGDHCVAGSVEKRTYVRVGIAAKPPVAETAPTTPPPAPSAPLKEKASSPSPPAEKDADPDCNAPGPAVRVEISPKSAVIGPGERICLDAASYDAHGCKTGDSPRPHWTAEQDGRVIPRLLSGNGCFQAGETAADSEGTYLVTARINGRSADAEISVLFPDLGELFAARLRPLEDIVETKRPVQPVEPPPPTLGQSTIQKTKTGGPASPAIQPADAADNAEGALLIGIIIAMVLLVGGAVLFFKLRRVPADDDEEDYEDNVSVLLQESSKKSTVDRESMSKSRPPTARVKGMMCPSCGNRFDIFSKFCPYDKHDLVPIPSGSQDLPTGMICPKCHRGYDSGAKFCPHDAARLVPYSEWRLSKLPPAP